MIARIHGDAPDLQEGESARANQTLQKLCHILIGLNADLGLAHAIFNDTDHSDGIITTQAYVTHQTSMPSVHGQSIHH